MGGERAALIRRNKNFIQIPMPNLSKMTNEELEKRADLWEKSFEMAFDEENGEDEDL